MKNWLTKISLNQKVLYHGTPFWLVENILVSGIRPSSSRLERNWDQSSSDHVYLSLNENRALQWGIHALESGEYGVDSTNAKVAILNVDISKINRSFLSRDPNSIRGDFRYNGVIPANAISLLKIVDLSDQEYWKDYEDYSID